MQHSKRGAYQIKREPMENGYYRHILFEVATKRVVMTQVNKTTNAPRGIRSCQARLNTKGNR